MSSSTSTQQKKMDAAMTSDQSFIGSATQQPGVQPVYTKQPGNELPQEGGCGFSLGENCPCCPANCSFGCC